MCANSVKPLLSGVLLACSLAASIATPSNAMAAEINVTTLTDEDLTNADCSLREAIVAANTNAANKGCIAGSGADTIRFLETGTIVLTASLPNITESLSVVGPGAANLTIDGDEQFAMFYFFFPTDEGNHLLSGLSLIDGASASNAPAVHLLNDVHVVLEDAIITGMRRTSIGSGGAIDGQSAALTIRRTTFFDNSTLDGGGGAISASGIALIVEDSLFVGNHANGTNSNGGAFILGNGGTATLRRSTFSGNTADANGGAVSMIASNASMVIENSTFKGNSAGVLGGAFHLNAGTASASNSVFAENQIDPPPGGGDPTSNISQSGGGSLTSLGHNFIGDNTGAATAFPAGNPNANDDYVGTTAAPIDPLLVILADNGGPTFTHRIPMGSPLIDQGSCTGEPHDQRLYGHPNPIIGRIIDVPAIDNADDGCDIGAFERGAQIPEPLFLDGFETTDP
ncbi:MAG: CSLREA domain-containing protein [Xanthomonadales bacterium]|nr:CSLREA domain-containing protein [Xanthomonadales bacterium]